MTDWLFVAFIKPSPQRERLDEEAQFRKEVLAWVRAEGQSTGSCRN